MNDAERRELERRAAAGDDEARSRLTRGAIRAEDRDPRWLPQPGDVIEVPPLTRPYQMEGNAPVRVRVDSIHAADDRRSPDVVVLVLVAGLAHGALPWTLSYYRSRALPEGRVLVRSTWWLSEQSTEQHGRIHGIPGVLLGLRGDPTQPAVPPPGRLTCPSCEGTGRLHAAPAHGCPLCVGLGHLQPGQLPVDQNPPTMPPS